MLYFLIVLIIILGVVIIVSLANLAEGNSHRKNQSTTNIKVLKWLDENNFKISKKFYINDYFTYEQPEDEKKFVAIDNDNKQICLIDYKRASMLIVKFSEILNYEIYENGTNVTTGGNVGGFGAGIFGAETNVVCKELKLIIRLKRYDTSQVCYDIVYNTNFNIGIEKSSPIYTQCISSLQELVSFLEVLKNENSVQK